MSVASLLTTAATTTNSNSVAKVATSNDNDNVEKKANSLIKKINNPSDLQQRLEKQLKRSRQTKAYPSKPSYGDKAKYSEEQAPLVSISNSDDDDFDYINLKTEAEDDDELVVFKQPRAIASKYRFSTSEDDCKQHLLRDGFRLDELSDDEDLDLIPPKPEGTTWCSCEGMPSCSIQ